MDVKNAVWSKKRENMFNAAKDYFDESSLDLVTSNCVLNLTKNKQEVLDMVYKLLKNGGEVYFSDIYSDRRLPYEIQNDSVLKGECLGGALYENDFIRICRKIGFTDPRIVTKRKLNIDNPKIKKLIGNIEFYSITYRLWKIDDLEDACEDFGQIAIYKGGIEYSENKYKLDSGHIFYKNKPEKVCGNTSLMLNKTRLNKYFEIIGSFDEHFGLFKDCGTSSSNSFKDLTSNLKLLASVIASTSFNSSIVVGLVIISSNLASSKFFFFLPLSYRTRSPVIVKGTNTTLPS